MGAQQMMRDLRMNMIPIKNRLLFFFSMTLKICPGCHPQFNINLTFYSFFMNVLLLCIAVSIHQFKQMDQIALDDLVKLLSCAETLRSTKKKSNRN